MQPDGMATGCGKLSAAATAPGRPDAAGLERPRAASQTGRVISAISIGCPALAAAALPAVALERSQVPAKFKWDLTPLYLSESAWQNAKTALANRIPGVAKFQGHLGDSPAALATALDAIMDLDRDLSRLGTY